MRSTDERLAAVHRRADAALAVLVILLALPLVDLAGRHAISVLAPLPTAGTGLFGASSLLGLSAGGYVLVAVISFAVAVVATALVMLRRRAKDDDAGGDEGAGHNEKQ